MANSGWVRFVATYADPNEPSSLVIQVGAFTGNTTWAIAPITSNVSSWRRNAATDIDTVFFLINRSYDAAQVQVTWHGSDGAVITQTTIAMLPFQAIQISANASMPVS